MPPPVEALHERRKRASWHCPGPASTEREASSAAQKGLVSNAGVVSKAREPASDAARSGSDELVPVSAAPRSRAVAAERSQEPSAARAIIPSAAIVDRCTAPVPPSPSPRHLARRTHRAARVLDRAPVRALAAWRAGKGAASAVGAFQIAAASSAAVDGMAAALACAVDPALARAADDHALARARAARDAAPRGRPAVDATRTAVLPHALNSAGAVAADDLALACARRFTAHRARSAVRQQHAPVGVRHDELHDPAVALVGALVGAVAADEEQPAVCQRDDRSHGAAPGPRAAARLSSRLSPSSKRHGGAARTRIVGHCARRREGLATVPAESTPSAVPSTARRAWSAAGRWRQRRGPPRYRPSRPSPLRPRARRAAAASIPARSRGHPCSSASIPSG